MKSEPSYTTGILIGWLAGVIGMTIVLILATVIL